MSGPQKGGTSGYTDGADYLAGYAIECALKACIARKTERFEFPDKARAQASYEHDISKLLKTAGLDEIFSTLQTPDAEDLLTAIEDRKLAYSDG